MIFQHTIDKVLSGEKTQTRRKRRLNEMLYDGWAHVDREVGRQYLSVWTPRKNHDFEQRCLYMIGNTYAVQPGRGQKAVARIEITDIREEDVRFITGAAVKAEGFTHWGEFLKTWTRMHDKPAYNYLQCDLHASDYEKSDFGVPPHVFAIWSDYLDDRPRNRYSAWVLAFKLVQS